ncbi:MBL fold metallo-hydrolase [Paenibacillus kobensis]|uniref:MBL fold metallo-hydrolase n=1 Tax=Paenibacillus kobensis TaxID=59841 RepID=UPI0027D891A6|nr:MBL fold metallo-hydrolase [Paenibacillus kobensis]
MFVVYRYGSIYQMMIGNPDGLSVNVFAVQEHDGLTLIDTAIPPASGAILQEVNQIGLPVIRIILTHGHHDHTGGLDLMKEAFPEAIVCISRRESRIVQGDLSLEDGEEDMPVQGIYPERMRTPFDLLLEDGDRIGSLLVIAVPGHTPGSIALLDERTRTLIAGDAFQSIGGLAVAGQFRPAIPMHAKGTWSNAASLTSARTIRTLAPSLLCVGHGPSLADPGDAMDQAIAEAGGSQI